MAHRDSTQRFERGAVVISFDTEQIWGYLDFMGEEAFRASFPGTRQVAADVLDLVTSYGISATWCVVGGLSLEGSDGASSSRFHGSPTAWVRAVPSGDENAAPLWYARSFIERLRDNGVHQEVGLHGGLTHLLWALREITLSGTSGTSAMRGRAVARSSFVCRPVPSSSCG